MSEIASVGPLMKGDGYYDNHSGPQLATIEAVLPWLEEAVQGMELATHGGPVVVADFGCSEGRNSIFAAGRIITALRKRTERPIQTIHSDLPTNNFNRLFVTLHSGDVPTYRGSDVFAAAVGGSMFNQLLPPNTVTVATTFNAIGFLDRRPATPLPDFILPMGPGRSRDGVGVAPAARQVYADQARTDLVRFYRARAAELVPGGKLLVASFGVTEQYRACDGLYDVLNDALLDLVASGRIPRQSYESLLFPIYFRTAAELVAPVADAHGELAKLFRLDRVGSMEINVEFNQRLHETGDARVFASEFSAFMRAFTEPILRMQFADQRDVESLIDECYRGVESRLEADPTGYAFHYIQVVALFTRLPAG